jgi:hypothetical protein
MIKKEKETKTNALLEWTRSVITKDSKSVWGLVFTIGIACGYATPDNIDIGLPLPASQGQVEGLERRVDLLEKITAHYVRQEKLLDRNAEKRTKSHKRHTLENPMERAR